MNETFLSGWGSASKVGIALVATAAITGGSMIAAETAQAAGFTGYYAGPNWTQLQGTTPGGAGILFDDPGDGGESVIISRSPSVTRTISILPEPGSFNFTFRYSTTSNAFPFTYFANGTSFLVPAGVSDVITIALTNPSQPIGFSFGPFATGGALTITEFSTPVPSPAMLPGLIGAGVAFLRKKDGEEASEEA